MLSGFEIWRARISFWWLESKARDFAGLGRIRFKGGEPSVKKDRRYLGPREKF